MNHDGIASQSVVPRMAAPLGTIEGTEADTLLFKTEDFIETSRGRYLLTPLCVD